MLSKLQNEMLSLRNPAKAKLLQGFFKTGKGEYGEGDIFYGITVPQTRAIAKKYSKLNLTDAEELLRSKIHEERLCALLLLVENYEKKGVTEKEKEEIVKFYLKNTKLVNNWDLVDLSAHHILGEWLYMRKKKRKLLYTLAKSENLWERRISIITCFYFIKNKDYKDALKIAKIHLNDEQDLMHKAVGWMLREIGKKDLEAEEEFLKKHYKKMPRTMLRYAIEKFSENKRQKYLKGKA